MKNHSSKMTNLIKIILAVVAVVNLILLFVFQYELPFFKHDENSSTENVAEITSNKLSDAVEPETVAEGWTFNISPDTITYNGEGQLDIMQGVSLRDPNGKSSDAEVVTTIYTGSTLSDKVIEYTANTDAGQVTGQRSLTLNNYKGPSITIPDTLPELEERTTDALLAALNEDGSVEVLDGFGNDLSDKLKVSFSREVGDGGHTLCTFQASNRFGDTVTRTAYLPGTAEKPEICLTDEKVTISVGTAFDPLTYLKCAVAVDGSDLADTVKTDGIVDTSKAGTCTISYTCTGQDGTVSDPKVLTVVVQ